MNTIFIGIAGGTGSGKTTLTEHLVSRFGDDIAVVHHDNYYKRQDCSFEERCKQNYDHTGRLRHGPDDPGPEKLKAGQTIYCPVYDYALLNRTDQTVEIRPAKVIIVEGILIFQNKELRDLLDIKIFVETDADVRILRRALRDVEERGRSMQSVVTQYLTTVKPMHEQFVEPTRKYADIVVLEAGLVLLAAVLVMMAVQAGNRPGPEDCTVVVLGCQVSASGEPTVMLRDRIDAAYDYLTAHPESRCVASGGQNDNEPISEAACIRNTLAARGIDPDRILLEDRSRSTEENLRFTAEIIRQQGLNPRVAIASDNFHQLRASVWAGRCGLEAESLGCASWWPLGPGYWAREAVAVVVLEVGSLLQGG